MKTWLTIKLIAHNICKYSILEFGLLVAIIMMYTDRTIYTSYGLVITATFICLLIG